ncbi:MAG TPA: ABC transporter substrate-binding protein [Gaiellaceae bacterium]|jgi:branched-chain amino acid transport system substrate-binding protein|nr:ABC transporter substrate-binding protein [Gaiellaceae bacterium]
MKPEIRRLFPRRSTLLFGTATVAIVGLAIGIGSAGARQATTAPEPTAKSLTSGCSSLPVKTAKIGMLVPITGAFAADAKDVVNAGNMAIGELNAAGGVCGTKNRFKFQSVVADTQNQRADAVISGFKRLSTTSDLNFVMTAYASTSNFEETLMAKANMPYLISANAAQTRGIISKDPSKYPTVWSRVPSYDAYGTALPMLLEQWGKAGYLKLGNRTAYIISSDDPYGSTIAQGLKKTFTSLGWKILGYQTVPAFTVTDWHATLGKIAANPPTIIILTDSAPPIDAAFQNQFMEKPMKSLVFLQYGPSVPEFQKLTGKNANGVIYNLLGGAIPTRADTKAITAKYQKKYGPGGYFMVAAYNEVYLYAYCVHKVGDPTDRTAIGKCFSTMDIDSPAGRIVFDQKTHLALQGNQYMPILFYQFQNGKRELIYPPKYASAHVVSPPWITSK